MLQPRIKLFQETVLCSWVLRVACPYQFHLCSKDMLLSNVWARTISSRLNRKFFPLPSPRGGTPDFKWRACSNGGEIQNPKTPMLNFLSLSLNFQMQCNSLNIKRLKTAAKTSYDSVLYSQNYAAGSRARRHYHESSDCFEYTKKSLLKSSHPRKYLQKFSFPKNPCVENFTLPKNPSVIPVTWNPWSPHLVPNPIKTRVVLV